MSTYQKEEVKCMLRNMYKADLPAVLAIEEAVHIAPWNEATFMMCFQSGYSAWVLEADDKIVGFIIVSLRAQECHILNLCVMHTYQRKGYGRQLLEYALTQARREGIGIAYLEVRRSNTRAIALYQKMKFLKIGERENYYPTVAGHEEDALIFAKSLVDAL